MRDLEKKLEAGTIHPDQTRCVTTKDGCQGESKSKCLGILSHTPLSPVRNNEKSDVDKKYCCIRAKDARYAKRCLGVPAQRLFPELFPNMFPNYRLGNARRQLSFWNW